MKIKISELLPPSHILNSNWVWKSRWGSPMKSLKINIGSFLLNNPAGRSIYKGKHNSTRWKVRVSKGENRNHEIQKKAPKLNSFLNWSNKLCNTWRFWNYTIPLEPINMDTKRAVQLLALLWRWVDNDESANNLPDLLDSWTRYIT